MKPKEVKEYLLDFFAHYLVRDYCEYDGEDFKGNATCYINYSPWGTMGFDDGTVEKEMEDLVNDYIDKNVTGKTKEEMVKSFMDFVEKDLKGLLKDLYAEAVENIASADSSSKWKDVYIDYLSVHADEVGGCELSYLNEDDIPELY